MNKISIKVIKRKEKEVIANVETQSPCEPKLVATVGEEKIERRLHRKMIDTVSNWISERRINNHIEEISAIRKLFGKEPILNKF